MQSQQSQEYILGLDIGVNSIGWALIATTDGRPSSIVKTGVRVFPFDADFERDFRAGKPASLAAPRREARLLRRMVERRVRRQAKLFNLLVKAGFLPAGKPENVIPALDREILARYAESDKSRLAHVLPYELRKRALDVKLDAPELGRALYHLAQRRGFLSNRKAAAKKGEDEKSVVKGGISQLQREIAAAGARTLGEYFAGLDPTQQRIRNRYTSRAMYQDEFDRMWDAQRTHYPVALSEELRKRVKKAIFHQRPLKSAKGLVGTCEHEPKKRRAAWAFIISQRFRTWQQVNNAEAIEESGEIKPLTQQQRRALFEALDRQGDLSFKQAKKILGLSRQCAFNFESGEETRFMGNRTNAKLAAIFGEKWWTFSDEERDRIVHDVISVQKDETLEMRGRRWGLSEEAARQFGSLELEPDYCRLSRSAMTKLLPHLEDGLRYAEAAKAVYGSPSAAGPAVDNLPPVSGYAGAMRNPVVTRVLSELRKIVNAVTAEYGKPAQIRIELARDMKKPARERREITKRNRDNERQRVKSKGRILAETSIQNPTRDDILKVLLADECKWICPYTGRQISMGALFGSHPEFDIEHIVPFSVCLDDSFMNKTLCYVEENRSVKRNRTPYEAYSANPQKYDEILQRVSRFQGTGREAKLWRFKAKGEDFEDFVERQLNDTRYATKQAVDYVGLLYGGIIDENSRRRVQASKGQVTWCLRNEWRLNEILGDGGEKSRDDHRHHAVDAICIALTDAGTVKALSDAAARAQRERRRRFGRFDEPFEGFLEAARQAVMSINVSHRVSRKANGPLHEQTIYGVSGKTDKKGNQVRCVRKALEALSENEVGDIVDDEVRRMIREKLADAGAPPKKVFAQAEDHPFLTAKDGRKIPIHRVRIHKAVATQRIGQDNRGRNIVPGSNHHVEIFETKDAKGCTRWVGRMVTRLEAVRRLARHQPIVNKEHEEGSRFRFSVAPGEAIELDCENGREMCLVRTISVSDKYVSLEYVGHADARRKEDIKAARAWKKVAVEPLRKMNCRKILVTPLGEVRTAND